MAAGIEEFTEAPEPVRRLVQRLAERRTPLEAVAILNPAEGDRYYLAMTSIGEIRVWANRGHWYVDLRPRKLDVFVDAGIWAACRDDTRLKPARPSLDDEVAWINRLLDDTLLPPFDAHCLAARARHRRELPRRVPHSRLLLAFAMSVALVAAMIWVSHTFDVPSLRVMASTTVAALIVPLAAPYGARWRAERAYRKACAERAGQSD